MILDVSGKDITVATNQFIGPVTFNQYHGKFMNVFYSQLKTKCFCLSHFETYRTIELCTNAIYYQVLL
jgi:hypothetical protein